VTTSNVKMYHSDIQIAWEHAKNLVQRKKHVSIILRNDAIVSIQGNGFEVPSQYAYRGYRSLHSEIHAFMKMQGPKDNLTLLNFRFNNAGQLRMAKPCKICMPWCEAMFDTIIYSDSTGQIVELKGVK
jgi:hypothetical protein